MESSDRPLDGLSLEFSLIGRPLNGIVYVRKSSCARVSRFVNRNGLDVVSRDSLSFGFCPLVTPMRLDRAQVVAMVSHHRRH